MRIKVLHNGHPVEFVFVHRKNAYRNVLRSTWSALSNKFTVIQLFVLFILKLQTQIFIAKNRSKKKNVNLVSLISHQLFRIICTPNATPFRKERRNKEDKANKNENQNLLLRWSFCTKHMRPDVSIMCCYESRSNKIVEGTSIPTKWWKKQLQRRTVATALCAGYLRSGVCGGFFVICRAPQPPIFIARRIHFSRIKTVARVARRNIFSSRRDQICWHNFSAFIFPFKRTTRCSGACAYA